MITVTKRCCGKVVEIEAGIAASAERLGQFPSLVERTENDPCDDCVSWCPKCGYRNDGYDDDPNTTCQCDEAQETHDDRVDD